MINIIVTLQIEGLHCWPDAAAICPQVDFLSNSHRHLFYIVAKKQVFHDDRDIEFILFKREILKYLNTKYFNSELNQCNFGSMSCEAICKELIEQFGLNYCSVMEDNENGAEIIK